MHSRFIRPLYVVFLMAAPLGFCTDIPKSPISPGEFSTVVASPEIRTPLTNRDLNAAMREAAHVMRLEDRDQDRPQIVILQIAPAEAKRLGLTHTVLLTNKGKMAPAAFYEVWIVGQYALVDLARGVETIYEAHFGLHYTDKERGRVVKQIASMLGGTIDVNALREEYQGGENR